MSKYVKHLLHPKIEGGGAQTPLWAPIFLIKNMDHKRISGTELL